MISRCAFLIGMLLCGVHGAWAQPDYPHKPIQLVVPFAPGGTADIVARTIADPLGKMLKQPVLVVNRAGGGGVIGALETVRAPADGYSLGMATVSSFATNPAINPKIPYHPLMDFTPVVNLAATPNVLAVHPRFAGHNVATFTATLKASPGKYSYASGGTGSITHLLMESYNALTGTFVTHIPYRGAGPALSDTVAGQVPMIFDNLPSTLPFVREKRLIPILVAAPQRLAVLPDVPTFKEVGLEPVNRMAYYGIYGPKGLPKDVVLKINAAVMQVLQDPAVRQRIEDTGSMVLGSTPEEFAERIRQEYDAYQRVVRAQKLTLD